MTLANVTAETRVQPHNAVPSATWSSAGAAYDEVSRGISDAIEHCINRLEPKTDERLLDLATGTGWTARRLADRGFDVTACDFAPDVVTAAEEYASTRNLDIVFHEGDAEALPYVDGAFDALISTFGVMFVQRPEDAAAELARVLRPGGRLALANWTPDGNVFEMFKIMKGFMPKPAGTPPPSPFSWGDPDYARRLLAADFELTFETGTSYYREPNGLAAWETFSTGYGPLKTLAGKLDETNREILKSELVKFHDSFATNLGVCIPRHYLIVHGVKR